MSRAAGAPKTSSDRTINFQRLARVALAPSGSMSPPTTFGRSRQRGRIGVSVYTRLRALIR